jgi:hypothetical protein
MQSFPDSLRASRQNFVHTLLLYRIAEEGVMMYESYKSTI